MLSWGPGWQFLEGNLQRSYYRNARADSGREFLSTFLGKHRRNSWDEVARYFGHYGGKLAKLSYDVFNERYFNDFEGGSKFM